MIFKEDLFFIESEVQTCNINSALSSLRGQFINGIYLAVRV
jgi:hypothetical protein